MTDVKTSSPTKTVMKEKDLVLFYFSASWCPPCQTFTPVLSEFYTKCCVRNATEIIFISSDQTIEAHNEYFAKMPFASLPVEDTAHIKQKLADMFKISGIPSLIVLDAKTGKFVTDLARNEVSSISGADLEKGKELIGKWKEVEAVPIEEAQLSGSGPPGLLGCTIL